MCDLSLGLVCGYLGFGMTGCDIQNNVEIVNVYDQKFVAQVPLARKVSASKNLYSFLRKLVQQCVKISQLLFSNFPTYTTC